MRRELDMHGVGCAEAGYRRELRCQLGSTYSVDDLCREFGAGAHAARVSSSATPNSRSALPTSPSTRGVS